MPLTIPLTPELFWLALSLLATALMWIPYVLNRIAVNGVYKAMGGSDETAMHHDRWAERAKSAHANAIENLAIFAPIVIVASLTTSSSSLTTLAAEAYLLSRIAHYSIYMLGIPVLRTLTFAIGWAAQIVILAHIFHLM